MHRKIRVKICRLFEQEARALLIEEELSDIQLALTPEKCRLWTGDDVQPDKGNLIGICCNGNQRRMLGTNPEQGVCMLISRRLAQYYIGKGCYLIAPGWIRNWRSLSEGKAKKRMIGVPCIQDGINKLLLLDTGVYADIEKELAAFAAYVGLSYEIIPVGLEYFRLRFLEKVYRQVIRKKVNSVKNGIHEREVRKEMNRIERVNLVGEMAVNIGHEIRNPLTTVRGFLQRLGLKPECHPYKEFFNLMIDEVDRANAIITQFLSMAKNKAVNFQLLDLNEVILNLHPSLQEVAAGQNKQIEFWPNNSKRILIDQSEISQVILNLVHNGLDAMAPGGKLTIKTVVDKQKVVLEVRDQGRGIPPEIVEKLGTPFLTTKENGTGLGLAVCYSIAARHNAAIKVNTGENGTTICVVFPQAG